MAKIGQNGEEYGHMEHVDMVGGLGPTCHATWPHLGTAWCQLGTSHINDPWELLQSQSLASIQVGLINGQDWMLVDSWAHCCRLGSLHQLPIQISTCVVLVTDLEEQPRCYDAMAVDLSVGRCPPYAAQCPRVAIDLLATYKYPHASLHYKKRVRSLLEKCSIYFQALQSSLSFLA
jgi:hypothetical protein